jgi:hypothetical protein
MHAVTVAPDGSWPASGSCYGTVDVWAVGGTLLITLTRAHGDGQRLRRYSFARVRMWFPRGTRRARLVKTWQKSRLRRSLLPALALVATVGTATALSGSPASATASRSARPRIYCLICALHLATAGKPPVAHSGGYARL